MLCELDAAVTAREGRDGRSEPPDVAPLAAGMPRALTATQIPLPMCQRQLEAAESGGGASQSNAVEMQHACPSIVASSH